jgi:Flp pilus assembly pilin Flp
VEYALILVLVAIVVISALTLLGPTIGEIFSEIANDLGDSPEPHSCEPWPNCG